MIEDGQVIMTVLGPFSDGILRIAAASAARTDEISYTIRRKWIVIKGEISLVGSTTLDDAVFYPAKAAESYSTFMDPTSVQAERTGDTVFCTRRVLWQSISPAAAIMNLLDFWPDLVEVRPDTVSTETNYIGDGSRSLAAMSAGTHIVARLNREALSLALSSGYWVIYSRSLRSARSPHRDRHLRQAGPQFRYAVIWSV
jgi:hypothetical protein